MVETWFGHLNARLTVVWSSAEEAATSPLFYSQLGVIVVALVVSALLSLLVKHRIGIFRSAPTDGPLLQVRSALHRAGSLVQPALALITLGAAADIAEMSFGENWLIVIARSIAAIVFFYSLISRLVQNPTAKFLLGWVGVPIAILHVLGWLAPVIALLDGRELVLGNFNFSLWDLLRTLIFGALLFWIGAVSNSAGKSVIRSREGWNPGAREIAAKLFEIVLFLVIFLLILQVMGINLTALTVFGGALGIGIGFGLQQIASNFISGIIILLDRSVTPGDFIELEDGRSGWLRELNMRYGILETYDGKDIMVPNEQFITSSYTNWTHKDKRQRYALDFQVAYSTDLDLLFERIREICCNHPKVLHGPDLSIEYQPDAEIKAFGDSGIDILVEFWMNGIDDGENRVGADLMHSIWKMIQAEGMEIPFPQREIRIIGGSLATDDR